MKVTFFGAAHMVTGSCHLVEVEGKRILLDCGMFQGSDYDYGRNADAFEFDPKSIDALVLSHAHADHSARIPKLIHDGFTGNIYGTKPTLELAELIWRDSYGIMKNDNRKYKSPITFQEEDIDGAVSRSKGVEYNTEFFIGDAKIVLKDAGHIFGSAFIELTGDGKTLAYSGDIGNSNAPIIRETDQLGNIDVLLMESTYGDRVHETERQRKEIILEEIKKGCTNGGTIMMPAFSLERTQEIIYMLEELFEKDHTLPNIPIFLDSPLAIRAMPIYERYPEYYDRAAAKRFKESGDGFLQFDCLTYTKSVDESKAINVAPKPKMIIAGSGMMTGGRIIHHAKRYLSDPKSALILVGYQAQGTLGRRLYEGAEKVKIHGEEVPVRCHIRAIGALSAHGDSTKLLSWVRNAEKRPAKVYCIHGEAHEATALAHKVRDDLDIPTFVPELGDTIEV
ncbi:MAG: MBL fold metallo-hydrolase [Candidatus Magasanikbacteria bacterium]|jgi:metallo-beta-lactamase family protein|nr:MBL fold metallo-hydrolase [Candidatus Magasanikbacteria bacterium]